MQLRILAFVFLFWGVAQPAPGWDAAGHEIIATLADARLNPNALQAVRQFAQALPTPGQPYDSVTIACWMDDLRRDDLALPQHGLFYTWHYIDLGIDPGDPMPSFVPGNDNALDGNAVQGLKRAVLVLQGGTDPFVKSKAVACALVMHLVGDLHQPLHAATHYYYTPGGWLHHDAGGNREYVSNGPGDDPRFNLHNFWDSAYRASFDEITGRVILDDRFRADGLHDPSAVQAIAQELTRTPPPSSVNLQPRFDDWARESNRIARDFVYRDLTATESKKECRLSSAYVAQAQIIARQRMVLAAWRLAELLNETMGASPVPASPASGLPTPANPPAQ